MRLNPRYPVDLHLHSVFSDGLCSPEALAQKAEKLHLTHIALCDHDTMDGLFPMRRAVEEVNGRRAAGGEPPLCLIPCVELSAGSEGRTHILGYGADAENQALVRCLRDAREDRARRAAQMIERLRALGVVFPPETLERLGQPSVGRAHIARAMVAVGAARTVQDAFDRYLEQGKAAYVPRSFLSASDAVSLLSAAGAVPVLAHPCRLPLDEPALFSLMEALAAKGLRGVEAYHPSATRFRAQGLERYARRNGLLVTGGSDFHGDPHARAHVSRMPGGWARCGADASLLMKTIADG